MVQQGEGGRRRPEEKPEKKERRKEERSREERGQGSVVVAIWREFHLGFGAMRGLFGEVDGGLQGGKCPTTGAREREGN